MCGWRPDFWLTDDAGDEAPGGGAATAGGDLPLLLGAEEPRYVSLDALERGTPVMATGSLLVYNPETVSGA